MDRAAKCWKECELTFILFITLLIVAAIITVLTAACHSIVTTYSCRCDHAPPLRCLQKHSAHNGHLTFTAPPAGHHYGSLHNSAWE